VAEVLRRVVGNSVERLGINPTPRARKGYVSGDNCVLSLDPCRTFGLSRSGSTLSGWLWNARRPQGASPPEDCDVLKEQLLRASYSVPLNIAEGSARKGSKEFRRFLDVARGSLAEVQNILELAKDQAFVDEQEYNRLDAIATETAKTLWGFLRKMSDTATRFPAP
jgi:four helix bundle protein